MKTKQNVQNYIKYYSIHIKYYSIYSIKHNNNKKVTRLMNLILILFFIHVFNGALKYCRSESYLNQNSIVGNLIKEIPK